MPDVFAQDKYNEVPNPQEHKEKMDDGSKKMGILRKNQHEMLEIENTVTEGKSAFDGLKRSLPRKSQ